MINKSPSFIAASAVASLLEAAVEVNDARLPMPMSLVLTESIFIDMISPEFTPVCKSILPAEPSKSLMPF